MSVGAVMARSLEFVFQFPPIQGMFDMGCGISIFLVECTIVK